MKRAIAACLTITLLILGLPSASYGAAVACPETWDISPTVGEINLVREGSIPENLNGITGVSEESIRGSLKTGTEYLTLRNFSSGLPPAYYTKILEGGRNIAISGQWKRSADGKEWKSFAGTNWDLMPLGEDEMWTSEMGQRLTTERGRLISTVDASRTGMTPKTYVAYEIKVNVNGCTPKTFYERKSIVPSYDIATKDFSSLVDDYYERNPSVKQVNYLVQKKCVDTLNLFVSHVKTISSSSQTWTIQNTTRGVLDLEWTQSSQLDETCRTSGFPFFDIDLSPTAGDSCITLLAPGKSVFTYRTLKYPCTVSIDISERPYGSKFEVARFQISKLPVAQPSKQATILCTKGLKTMKVTSVKPMCPKGYKKK